MILHIAKLLLTLFTADLKRQQAKEFRNIHFDGETKISVLKDQILKYFSTDTMEGKFQVEEYIFKIIAGLKVDFKEDIKKVKVLEDIYYEMKYNQPQKKKMLLMIGDL